MRMMRAATAGLMMAAMAGSALAAKPAPAPMTPAAKEAAYFAKLARQPGVSSRPGIAWTVLKTGPADGPHPGRSDTVTIHYIGKLTDGTQFDASGGDGSGEASFKVSGVISGFAAALRLMRPGDKWRVYIPAYLAYGDQEKPKIPAGSTLVFDIDLLSVAPPPPPPPA